MARAAAQVAVKPAAGAPKARAAAPTYASILKSARMAAGGVIVDRAGVERIDLVNAEGAVLLGWADPRIENAVANDVSQNRHAEAAERIGMLLPCAEAVAFRSHLNHALADALSAAKTLTGRDGAFFCDDETVASGDFEPVSRALERHAGRVAALVIRPMEATKAFLAAARRASQRDGVLLVLDESRTAFRVHRGGAQGLHGVVPDICILGPSLANGRPIAAIAGRVEPMRLLTASGDAVPRTALAATCATLDRVAREDVPEVLTLRGAEIEAEIELRLERTGANQWLGLFGDPTWSLMAAAPRLGFDSEAMEEALALALYGQGVLSFGAHVPSVALNGPIMVRLLSAYDTVLPRIVDRCAAGEFDRRIRRSALAR
jgi:glutamate-1-semialdehyde 2,1-aminomutase